jgi:outer membrane lipoprotein-sorting protein
MHKRNAVRRVAMMVLGAALGAGIVAQAQTVDDLVAKNLQAKGGLEKLKAITTQKIAGTISAQGQEMKMTMWMKRPNMVMQEILVDVPGSGTMRMVQAFDGQRVWAINPASGSDTASEIQGSQADLMREQADFDGPLVDYKTKGNTIDLQGTDTVDGRKVHKLKITRKAGPPQTLYLDAETGLEAKVATQVGEGGAVMSIENTLSDYKSVNGVMVPHALTTSMNGQAMGAFKIQSVEFNTPIQDSLFRMPGK